MLFSGVFAYAGFTARSSSPDNHRRNLLGNGIIYINTNACVISDENIIIINNIILRVFQVIFLAFVLFSL